MNQKHMDYILLQVPRGSECWARYILGFSQYRIEKILLPEAFSQAQLVLGFSLWTSCPSSIRNADEPRASECSQDCMGNLWKTAM